MDRSTTIRPLGPDDAAAFCALRTRGLREHPEAFGRTPEEMDSQEVWTERLRAYAGGDLDFVLGAFDAERLVGVVGCHRDHGTKQRHVAEIWGMYVAPEHRGVVLGRRLVRATIERAAGWRDVEQIWLGVTIGNTAARALYATCGFKSIAVKPRVLKVGDRYYDQELMALDLRPGG